MSHSSTAVEVGACGFQGRLFRPGPGFSGEARGRVVLVHGLNLAPVTMDPMAEWLAEQGFFVARVALTGHRESFRELIRVHHDSWEADIEAAVAKLNRLDADARSAPLFGVGFSLGGLLLSHHVRKWSKSPQSVRVSKDWRALALIAPAFLPRLGAGFPLGVLPRWLPYFSFTPRRLRRWVFCPHNAYVAIAGLMRAHMSAVQSAAGNAGPRCTVVIHPRDELVHAGRLVDPVFGNGLASYEVQYVRDVHRRWTTPRHLICHPSALSESGWADLCSRISQALSRV